MNNGRGRKVNKSLKILTCKRCGYQWVPRVDTKPKSCALCKNHYWDSDYEYGKETVKKVSRFQKERWAEIRKKKNKEEDS